MFLTVMISIITSVIVSFLLCSLHLCFTNKLINKFFKQYKEIKISELKGKF